MNKLLTLLVAAIAVVNVTAQTNDYDQAYEACIKANNALDGGFANAEQLSSAATTLKTLKIGALQLKQTKGEAHSLNGHFVFTADFMNDCIEGIRIYEMAEQYAKRTARRGTGSSQVLMKTILVPAGKTYTYEIAGCTDEVTVGCVAETGGLFSWKVATTEYKTKNTQTYRDNKDQKKGRTARRMTVKANERYKITLEITNTTTSDCSFAVIGK